METKICNTTNKLLNALTENTVKALKNNVKYFINAGRYYTPTYTKPTNMTELLQIGSIDCNGWVNILTSSTFEEINNDVGKTIFDENAFKTLNGSSHDIISNICNITGLENPNNLKEGMLIGVSVGDYAWCKGRVKKGSQVNKNISHIAQVIKDTDNNLVISESVGIKGVSISSLDKWLQKFSKHSLFVVNPILLVKNLNVIKDIYGN